MTEQFPTEPARTERANPAAPRPAEQTTERQTRRLEQPIPAQAVPVRSWSVMLWAIVAGVIILGGMTALIGGSFWYAQNYRNELRAETHGPQGGEGGEASSAPFADNAAAGTTGSSGGGEQDAVAAAAEKERRLGEEAQRREEEARRQGQIIALRSLIDKTQRDLDDLLKSFNDWQNQVEPLLEGPKGRRIAGSAPHLERFVGVYEKERPSKSEISAYQDRLDALRGPLESATGDSAGVYAPSPELAGEVRDLDGEILAALRQYKQDNLAVESIVESCAEIDPSESTLTNAIRAFSKAEQDRRIEMMAESRRQASEKINRELAAAEAAKVEVEGRVELLEIKMQQQQAEDEFKELTALAADQAKAREAAREKAQLERDFVRDLPQIRKYLPAFLAEGYTQPDQYGAASPTSKKGPMSLSAMRSAGALREDVGGLSRLNIIASGSRNDRPVGGFPPWYGNVVSEKNIPYVQTAQKYLLKYGDLMVEKGLLAP